MKRGARTTWPLRSTWVLALVALVCALPAAAGEAAPGDRILGLWYTEPDGDDFARVEISRDDGIYRGEIVWLNQPLFEADEQPTMVGQPKTDRNNPDPQLRDRPIVGLTILQGFHYDADEELWVDGTIYDPKNGKTYRCKMWLEEDGDLGVRGFIGFSLLGRSTTWTREMPRL